MAVRWQNKTMVAKLLERGADVGITGYFNESVVARTGKTTVAVQNIVNVCNIILLSGRRLSATDSEGHCN